MKYEVRDVVCDYGVFEDDKLVLILKSKFNAELIKTILEFESNLPSGVSRPINKENLFDTDWVYTNNGEINPKESGEYLVLMDFGGFMIFNYSSLHRLWNAYDTGWSTDDAIPLIKIKAWMPIPKVKEIE